MEANGHRGKRSSFKYMYVTKYPRFGVKYVFGKGTIWGEYYGLDNEQKVSFLTAKFHWLKTTNSKVGRSTIYTMIGKN